MEQFLKSGRTGLEPRHLGTRNRLTVGACGRVAMHPGTETDSAMVPASPFRSVVHGMLRQPHW
jgi:hypothetical protein